MDFSLGSLVSSGNGVSAGNERSMALMAPEMDDSAQQQQRMLPNSALSPTSAEEIFIPNSPLKQRRSATEFDSSDRREEFIAPLKLARNDSFSSKSLQDAKMMQSGNAGTCHTLRNLPNVPESRMLCSPAAYRAISEDALLSNESTYLGADSKLLRGDPQLMCYTAAYLAGQSAIPLRTVPSFQHDHYALQHWPTSANLPLVMAREGLIHSGVHEAAISGRQVFTASQWAELEHQALIYKYLMHGAPVPAELLLPIRRSLATISGLPLPSQNLGNIGWTSFQLGAAGNVDPEPGRCRRTDGKKWRCARPVVPEQKYCERHVHRGRHRKKAAEAAAQNSAANASLPSPKASTSSSGGRDNSQTSPLASETHHALKTSPTPVSSHSSQMPPNKTFSTQNLHTSYGIAIGTTSAGSLTCNQFPLPLHSASTLSPSKHNRFMSGLSKGNFGLRPEQLLSDLSVITRGLGDHSHLSPALTSSQQLYCHMQPHKVTPSVTLKPSCAFFPAHQNSDHDLECFQEHDELAYMADATRLNMLLGHHEHQHLNRPSFFPGEALNDDSGKIPEGQALRHFFDDWPRNRDSSTLSWSDGEEEKQKVNGSSTQLSISISNNSSEISASDNQTRNKTMFSPLRLSMLKSGEDVGDPTHMGLGVGMGLGINNSSHKQACWFPRSLEQGVGGPLAEVLQSSAPHPGKKTSLNFLRDEWDASHHEAPYIASPTGVLQKVTLGTCFSDSSSNASSPGSVRNEHPIADNQRLNPVLTNCSSRLST